MDHLFNGSKRQTHNNRRAFLPCVLCCWCVVLFDEKDLFERRYDTQQKTSVKQSRKRTKGIIKRKMGPEHAHCFLYGWSGKTKHERQSKNKRKRARKKMGEKKNGQLLGMRGWGGLL